AASTCQLWRACADGDVVWSYWYQRRFSEKAPPQLPPPPPPATALCVAATAGESVTWTWAPFRGHEMVQAAAALHDDDEARHEPLPRSAFGSSASTAYNDRSGKNSGGLLLVRNDSSRGTSHHGGSGGAHEDDYDGSYDRGHLRGYGGGHEHDGGSDGDEESFGRVRALFRERWEAPHIGDTVEVNWEGRFRLEGHNLMRGLSWWGAQVEGTTPSGLYRITYADWASRWDEAVPRARLRWPLDPSDVLIVPPPSPRCKACLGCGQQDSSGCDASSSGGGGALRGRRSRSGSSGTGNESGSDTSSTSDSSGGRALRRGGGGRGGNGPCRCCCVGPSVSIGGGLNLGDSVEVWCIGAHVKGAWLVATVRRMRRDRLGLGDVSVAEKKLVWVDACRCRKILPSAGMLSRRERPRGCQSAALAKAWHSYAQPVMSLAGAAAAGAAAAAAAAASPNAA
ncbi:unnamed protein product, partial [Phaeothamnion confervicola]